MCLGDIGVLVCCKTWKEIGKGRHGYPIYHQFIMVDLDDTPHLAWEEVMEVIIYPAAITGVGWVEW